MVQIANPLQNDILIDPAAGTGSFLMAAHSYRSQNYDSPATGKLMGVEKDQLLANLGGAMVSLATNHLGTIKHGNSLDPKTLKPRSADIVLTNPPFGSKISITDKTVLQHYDFGYDWKYETTSCVWKKCSTVRISQDPQILFLELSLSLLKEGGLLGIVLPEGVFGNDKTAYVWDYIRSKGTIETLIDCPRTTFQPSTDVKTNILFIRKETRKSQVKTRIAIAKNCGHDRRGRTEKSNGDSVPNDFEAIGREYSAVNPSVWTSHTDLDKYYLVPRFYCRPSAKIALTNILGECRESVTIGELVKSKYLFVRKGHEVGAEAYGSGEIPFIRTSDISNWEISLNPNNGVSADIYNQYCKMQDLKAKDLLLVVDGRYKIGRCAILHLSNCKAVVQSHLRAITCLPGCPLDPYELLYVLSLPIILEQMRDLVFVQSTLGSLGKRLNLLEIPVPIRTEAWELKIGNFKRALEQRAHLLGLLGQYESPDPEL